MLSRVRAHLRYRRMQRLLRQLDRADARDRGRTRSVPRVRPSVRGPVLFAVGMALLIAALVAVRVWFPELALSRSRPAPDVVHHPEQVAAGPYEFMNTLASGAPVTYSSCEPVRFVINPAGMPPELPPLIREAAREVGSASGLRVVDAGLSDETPTPDRPVQQPERYGPGWVPVLVSWVDQPPATGAQKRGTDTFGVGGSTSLAVGGTHASVRYVTGEVTLFARALTRLLRGEDGPAGVRAVVMHEFGHVLGLTHTSDPEQLMTPVYAGRSGWGPGDLEGLRRLGAGPCVRNR